MVSARTFASLGLVVVAAMTAGCKKDPAPKPEPLAPAVATTPLGNRGKLSVRQPMAVPRVDPLIMKEYRVDVCYFGTLSLREARDAYLSSLGGAEPGPGKIPSFGGPPPPPAASASPSAPPAAAPASAGASAGPIRLPPRRPADFSPRPPHERNARACSVARGLKDPPMPDVDAALVAFSDFAIGLSKEIANATAYYMRKEYEGDKFAKGKELHKTLKEGFAKLDELSDKLGAAATAWRKEHPADVTKMEPGEKEGAQVLEDARTAMLAIAGHKPDPAAFKAGQAALEKSLAVLKARSQTEGADPWAKLVTPVAEDFAKLVADASPKVTDKSVEPEAYVKLVQGFVNLIEARQRALSRSLMAKAQHEQAAAAAASASAAPAPAAK